jgi:hypothetical protein
VLPTTSDTAAALVDFSLQSLPTMYQNDAGLFCEHRDQGGRQYRISSRYTLICLIGLHRARAAGHDIPFDADAIFKRVFHHDADTPADAGLRLWTTALYAPELGAAPMAALESQLSAESRASRSGMHLGLALSGLVAYAKATGDPAPLKRAAQLRNQIAEEYGKSPTGLFYHSPPATLRRNKPNFATQVYLMQGLAHESIASGEPLGVNLAEQCATALAAHQRSDGGWPWIYDTSGSTVEDFEIYSVHQDAMAPMAFLAVADAGRPGMWPLVDRGLEWMDGKNQMGLNMVDREGLLIYRSIRRPRPLDKIMLGLNTASAGISNKAPLHATGRVELNPTCRPYHLGWILEAWSDRLTVPGPAEDGSESR